MELHVDVLAVLGQAIDWVCSCIACVGCIRGFVVVTQTLVAWFVKYVQTSQHNC